MTRSAIIPPDPDNYTTEAEFNQAHDDYKAGKRCSVLAKKKQDYIGSGGKGCETEGKSPKELDKMLSKGRTI